MIRFALYLALFFLILGLLRVTRVLLRAGRSRGQATRRSVESEMVRDPICGTWIDRRLALTGRRAGETVAVCSDDCRKALEAR